MYVYTYIHIYIYIYIERERETKVDANIFTKVFTEDEHHHDNAELATSCKRLYECCECVCEGIYEDVHGGLRE